MREMAVRYVNNDKLVEAFLDKFSAQGTKEGYGQALRQFRRWSDAREIELLEVKSLDLERYFEERRKNWATSTLLTNQGALTSFYAFVTAEGLILTSPMAAIEREKVERNPGPTGLTKEDVASLLLAIEGRSDRDASLLLLLMLGGLRAREVTALDISDVRVNGDVAVVEVRGRKVGETQTLPPIIANRLAPLLAGRSNGPLFLTKDGTRYNRILLLKLARRVGRQAGIERRLGPQVLRTLMFEISLASGANPASVAEAAGFEDLRAFTVLLPSLTHRDRHPAFQVVRMLTDPGPLDSLVNQVEGLLLEPGIHPVAPILVAGAVLEARLRFLVQRSGATISEKPGMAKYIEALRRSKAITNLEWRELGVLMELRNQAAHGVDLDKLTQSNANKMVAGTRDFMHAHP